MLAHLKINFMQYIQVKLFPLRFKNVQHSQFVPCFQMRQHLLKPCLRLSNSLMFSRFQDYRVLEGITECWRVLQSVTKCYSVTECFQRIYLVQFLGLFLLHARLGHKSIKQQTREDQYLFKQLYKELEQIYHSRFAQKISQDVFLRYDRVNYDL